MLNIRGVEFTVQFIYLHVPNFPEILIWSMPQHAEGDVQNINCSIDMFSTKVKQSMTVTVSSLTSEEYKGSRQDFMELLIPLRCIFLKERNSAINLFMCKVFPTFYSVGYNYQKDEISKHNHT